MEIRKYFEEDIRIDVGKNPLVARFGGDPDNDHPDRLLSHIVHAELAIEFPGPLFLHASVVSGILLVPRIDGPDGTRQDRSRRYPGDHDRRFLRHSQHPYGKGLVHRHRHSLVASELYRDSGTGEVSGG